MKLSIEVLHTGTDDKFPEVKVTLDDDIKTQIGIYHRQQEGLWATTLGWPMGREYSQVAESLYKLAVRREYADEGDTEESSGT